MLLTNEQLKTCMDATGQEIVYRDGHYWMKKDEKEYLLMPWRTNKRLNNMRLCISNGSISDISAMKSECVVQRCFPLFSLAAKEIDICEWMLGEQVQEVFALTDEAHEIEQRITDAVNASGIGPIGLGGASSVLATFIKIGNMRASGFRVVSMRPNCCMEIRKASCEWETK